MKVAIVPSADLSYNSGSIIYAKNLHKFLIDAGERAYLLGSKAPMDVQDEYLSSIFIRTGLLEHPIINDRVITSLEYRRMFSTIVEYIDEVNELTGGLDIIHAHYASINSYAALFAGKLYDIPVVVTSFGRDVNIGCIADKRIREFAYSSLTECETIIVSEETLIDKIAKICPTINRKKIHTVPMPVNLNIMNDGNLHITNDKFKISTVNSCFSPEKGIETIIQAFHQVKKVKSDVILYIAGTDDHPDAFHLKKLTKLIDDLHLNGDIVLTGYLDSNNVGNLLRSSDLFIDARKKGNFSSVLLEAMMVGIPIICSRNEASEKMIIEGINGLYFDIGDEKVLVRNICKVINDSSLCKSLILGAKQWFKDNERYYSPFNCYQNILDISIDTINKFKR